MPSPAPTADLHTGFSAPSARATPWEDVVVVLEGRAERVTDDATLRVLAAMWDTKYDGDWKYDVADGAFIHEPGEAHVFEVRPRKVLSFAKGDFAQTRFRFDG